MGKTSSERSPTGYAVTWRFETQTLTRPASAYVRADGTRMTIAEIKTHEEARAFEALRLQLAEGNATIHAEVAAVYGDEISNHADFDTTG